VGSTKDQFFDYDDSNNNGYASGMALALRHLRIWLKLIIIYTKIFIR
jgi:hypothetical protein